jgi:hypothetical protein
MKYGAIVASAVLLGALFAPGVFAQATNPSYIAEFPSVDKVMAGMKTADPDESAARQMATFTWLMNMILEMAGPRQFIRGAGGMTADENKVRQDYNTALYNMQKSNPKYASPAAMRQLQFSLPFRNQMVMMIFPPTFPDEYTKVMAQTKQQSAQLHQQAVQQGQAQAAAAQPAQQQALNQVQEQLNQQQAEAHMDPQTREMRRCISSGRVIATCTGNALVGSLMPNVNGFLSSVAPSIVGKEVTGPQMAGVFAGAGNWRLEFSEASVALSCQDMIPDSHAYTISFANNRATLDIASTPKHVVLTVDGDTLNGASAMTVDGRISLGVRRKTDLQGQPVDVYTYQQVTRDCAKPALAKSNSPGVVGAEKNLATAIFNDGDAGPPTPPGLRMNGIYAASTGFSVEFFPESAILGCGPDVERAYPYTVVADGKQAVIKVAAPVPVTLQLKSNNALDPGTGSYQVQGRRITGQDDNDDYTFAPLNASCNLAVLAPGPVPAMAVATTATAGAAPAAAAGAGSPAAGAAAPAGSAAPAARAAAPAPPLATLNAPTGNAVLTILSGLSAAAGAPNALGGHPYILLRDDFATVVAKSGAAMAPGVSAVKTMGIACGTRTPDCQKIIASVQAESASAVVADATGKGVFPGVPPGTYYLMISAQYNNQPLLWSSRVNLKAGQNSVTLDQRNAVPVN